MTVSRYVITLAIAASLLAGCGSLKKLTGQRNDTVLPGERVNILPPDQQVNPKVNKAGEPAADMPADAAACDPSVDLNCPSSIDQEAAGTENQ
jgi:hypothetical protein